MINRFKIALLAAALLTAFCSADYALATPQTTGFRAYLGIGLEYDSTRNLVGANVIGYAYKKTECVRDAMHSIAQSYSHGLVADGHLLATSCLLVVPVPSAPHGLVEVEPKPAAKVLSYLGVAVEFKSTGDIYGAEKLGLSPDAKMCVKYGYDTIKSSYHDGRIPADRSIVIYCVPVPQPPKHRTVGQAV